MTNLLNIDIELLHLEINKDIYKIEYHQLLFKLNFLRIVLLILSFILQDDLNFLN